MGVYSTLVANIILFTIIPAFHPVGIMERLMCTMLSSKAPRKDLQPPYASFPIWWHSSLNAVFRTSGAMDIIVNGIGYIVGLSGADTEFVGALPTALMKSLSGSGANGLMIDTMKQYGADSFVGRMSCVARGASDTTFYILPSTSAA